MKAHEGARECDRDRGRQRQGKRKKGREAGQKTYLCTKLVLKGNKHTHLLEFDMKVNISGEGNETVFQESKWGHVTRTKM